MEVPFPRFIGMPSIKECRDDGQGIRWYSQEQGVDIIIAKSLDDCWKEVCNGTRGNEAE